MAYEVSKGALGPWLLTKIAWCGLSRCRGGWGGVIKSKVKVKVSSIRPKNKTFTPISNWNGFFHQFLPLCYSLWFAAQFFKLKYSWFIIFQVYSKVIWIYILYMCIYIMHIHVFMYIYTCICIIYIFFFRFFSFIGYHKILNIVPCAVQ